MQRKKILWLTNWYPNRNDLFDGDFIQRHARAAAIFHDVHVIFVTEAAAGQDPGEVVHRATGLTEQVIYGKRISGILGKVRRALHWKNLFMQAVEAYIRDHGQPDHVHIHIPWKVGIVALWVRQKYKRPFIVSEHWSFYEETIMNAKALEGRSTWMMKLLTRIYTEAQAVVAVSEHLSSVLQKTVGRKADYIIPNVVDTTLFFPGKEKYSRFTFIHVSNMVPVKNVGSILEAFAMLVHDSNTPDTQLVLVGNRDETYVEQARTLGLLNTSVFFRGELSYAEVADEMKRAHALVMYSKTETFSCVTAEALCCGLPVVASLAGALPELVNASNGIVVTPGNVEALSDALGIMRKEQSSFNGAAIADAAARKWGYGPVSEAFDQLYTELARSRPASLQGGFQG
jgi:glycosyltransferase involved in cell wall biosynthesis